MNRRGDEKGRRWSRQNQIFELRKRRLVGGLVKFKWAASRRLMSLSQNPFQVRELSSRQMVLADQNKELKEENDR